MDNDSDEVFTEKVTKVHSQQHPKELCKMDSITSTTSDDRDLLDTEHKLKGRPKISHPKPKHINKVVEAAKSSPSPKLKRADPTKSKPPTTGGKAVSKEEYEPVKTFTQTKPQKSFKPTIPQQKPVIGQKLHQASPKLSTNPQSSNIRRVSPSPGPGSILNTNHLAQTNPLAQLRAKSSPRVKPRSVSPAFQKKVTDGQPQKLDSKLTEGATATQQVTKLLEPAKEIKRSSIATDQVLSNDKAAAADVKMRHKSESSALANESGSRTSFKELRQQEADDFNQTFKDFDDFITTI